MTPETAIWREVRIMFLPPWPGPSPVQIAQNGIILLSAAVENISHWEWLILRLLPLPTVRIPHCCQQLKQKKKENVFFFSLCLLSLRQVLERSRVQIFHYFGPPPGLSILGPHEVAELKLERKILTLREGFPCAREKETGMWSGLVFGQGKNE